jgi:hypothetical protein
MILFLYKTILNRIEHKFVSETQLIEDQII